LLLDVANSQDGKSFLIWRIVGVAAAISRLFATVTLDRKNKRREKIGKESGKVEREERRGDGKCARTASELRQKTEIRVGYLPATSGRQFFIQEGISSSIDYCMERR
jgi:hypothetical protein